MLSRSSEMSLLDRSPEELRDPMRLMVESTAPSPIHTPHLQSSFSRHATAEPPMLTTSPLDDLPGAMQLLAPGLTSQDLNFSPTHSLMPPIRPPFSRSASTNDLVDELRHAKREIELLKTMDPFRVADMAIEIQVERMKLAEASSARDSAIQRLSSAYDSIKEKAVAIAQLQSEKADLERRIAEGDVWVTRAVENARAEERRSLEAEISALKELIKRLTDEIRALKGEVSSVKLESTSETTLVASPTDSYSTANSSIEDYSQRTLITEFESLSVTSRSQSRNDLHKIDRDSPFGMKHQTSPGSINSSFGEPLEMERARYALLAALPVPTAVPDDVLKPILIPSPFTIHEFLGNTSGSLRNSLYGYRVFSDKTTRWCPDNEEHGYFLTPLFKCTTNSKVLTAHRWNEVDPKGRMHKPTECFYNKEGKWYYAGQYIAMRLTDLTVKEWEALDTEASQMLVKETLANRKNTAAQNHFEVSQLYACGALKVACVGLQCVGFNSSLYRTIMEQASRCQQNGRWRSGWTDDSLTVPGPCDEIIAPSSSFFG